MNEYNIHKRRTQKGKEPINVYDRHYKKYNIHIPGLLERAVHHQRQHIGHITYTYIEWLFAKTKNIKKTNDQYIYIYNAGTSAAPATAARKAAGGAYVEEVTNTLTKYTYTLTSTTSMITTAMITTAMTTTIISITASIF